MKQEDCNFCEVNYTVTNASVDYQLALFVSNLKAKATVAPLENLLWGEGCRGECRPLPLVIKNKLIHRNCKYLR